MVIYAHIISVLACEVNKYYIGNLFQTYRLTAIGLKKTQFYDKKPRGFDVLLVKMADNDQLKTG